MRQLDSEALKLRSIINWSEWVWNIQLWPICLSNLVLNWRYKDHCFFKNMKFFSGDLLFFSYKLSSNFFSCRQPIFFIIPLIVYLKFKCCDLPLYKAIIKMFGFFKSLQGTVVTLCFLNGIFCFDISVLLDSVILSWLFFILGLIPLIRSIEMEELSCLYKPTKIF